MRIRATDDFQFEWPDPADAHMTWMWDQMHMPRPLPILAGIISDRVMSKVMGGRSLDVNGYAYRNMAGPPPWAMQMMSGPPPADADPIAIWEEDQLPKLKAIVESVRGRDYDAMSASRIVAMLDELIAENAEAMALTFGRAMIFMAGTNQLLDFCETELGPGVAVKVTTMLQGFENESAASGAGLSRLTELAAASPGVAAAVREARLDDLAREPGGSEFMAAFQEYLDAYGSRAPSWGQVHLKTWAEDPAVPLRLIAGYLDDPARSPVAAQRRAVAEREAAIAEVEAALAPDKLPRFRELLRFAQKSVPVSEGRAMWQLIASSLLRPPLLALGRKLVDAGYLEAADDVFYFSDEELVDMATGGAALNTRAVAAERRAELAHFETLTPPRTLGAPLPPALPPMMARFMGIGVVEQSADARVVKGIGASKGVARAVARVIMDLRDADKLGPGEVLVCPSTAPPWTPLFAIAGAVVTDSGGVLSHSAIAAREYAIPAVVGTSAGTQRIPDGAVVTVDGAQGLVRIED